MKAVETGDGRGRGGNSVAAVEGKSVSEAEEEAEDRAVEGWTGSCSLWESGCTEGSMPPRRRVRKESVA